MEKKMGNTQIDTLALFAMNNKAILNTNDCPFELASETIKANKIDKINIDLLLVGYAGAGPYPQCFEFDNIEKKIAAADAKKEQFLRQAEKYINLINPIAFSPFAGTYTLGSRLSGLTKYRGVPSLSDATKVLGEKFENYSKAVLLEKLDEYDLTSEILTKNPEKYPVALQDYVKLISQNPLEYDGDNWEDSQLSELINSSYKRFKSKAGDRICF